MKNNKSSGPDGLSVEFYKSFFVVVDIGTFLIRSINYRFCNEELSVSQRQRIITCIPKAEKPKRYLKNWRPISSLKTAYKIASACMANRLKTMLPKIIQEEVLWKVDRCIGENIRLLYDTLVVEKENSSGSLLVIDFGKTFDSVAWFFLQKALASFCSGPDIKRWIRFFLQGCIYMYFL